MTGSRFGLGSRTVALLACTMLALPPSNILAQQTSEPATQAATPDAASPEAAPLAVADELDAEPAFAMEELEVLVAPIALYPDPLLVQVLLAATYPLEVVRAHRFLQANPNLTPEELVDKAEQEGWDASVISLVAFPTVLERMATDLDWTESLGDAMALQSEDLLDAVQDLREQAQASGALQSNEYQTVAFSDEEMITIEPAKTEVIYVPQYEPTQVFVTQPASTTYVTQPSVVYRDGYSEGTLLAAGLVAFTTGILLGNYFGRRDKYDYYWGRPHSHVVWHHHRVYPPYYRPGGYRPPYYRPRPPGYRPGDHWRPRPELYRDARVRVDHRRDVKVNVKRDVNVNLNNRKRPTPPDRATTMQRQLKDRGRDRSETVRPSTPQRPATKDQARPETRPAPKDTAFGNRARTSDVRNNRDRGAASVNRAKQPATAPSQRPARPETGQRPQGGARPQIRERPQIGQRPQTGQKQQVGQRPKAPQRPQQGQRPSQSRPVFDNSGGKDAAKFSNRGKSSAGGIQRKR